MKTHLLYISVFVLFISISWSFDLRSSVKPGSLDEYGYSACQYAYTLTFFDAVNTITIIYPTTSQFIGTANGNQKFTITFDQLFGDSGMLYIRASNTLEEKRFDLDSFECLETPSISVDVNPTMVYSYYFQSLIWVAKLQTAQPMTKYLPEKSCNMQVVGQSPFIFSFDYLDKDLCIAHVDSETSGNFNTPSTIKFTPSISQDITVALKTPYSHDSYSGGQSFSRSTSTKDSFTAIMDYTNNVNHNAYFVDLLSSFKLLTTIEGNSINGKTLYYQNNRGRPTTDTNSGSSLSYNYNVLDINTQVPLLSSTSNLLATPTIFLASESSNVMEGNNADTAFLKVFYTLIRSSIYDYRNYVTTTLKKKSLRHYISFPFGYVYGSISNGHSMNFPFITSAHFAEDGDFITAIGENTPTNIFNGFFVSNNLQSPIIQSMDLLKSDNGIGLYKLVVSDSIEFINQVTSHFDESGIVLAGSESIISSDGGHNVEFEFFLNPLLHQDVYAFSAVGLYQVASPTRTSQPFKPSMINKIVFLENDIDTTKKATNNTMIIYCSNPNYQLRLGLYSTSLQSNIFYFDSVYDELIQAYIIAFTIPPNRKTGNLIYVLWTGGDDSSIPSEILDPLFGSLRLSSDNFDDMPPMITQLSTPSNNVPISTIDDFTELAFVVTVSDTYNGLLNGSFWITSNIDPYGYNITIDPSMADSGDKYLGVYSLKFSVSKLCKTQTYYIQYAQLMDTGYSISSTYTPFVDPFSSDLLDNGITIQCSEPDDASPPFLNTFNILNGTIDTSLENRVVVVNFSTDDTDIDYTRLPIVYAQEIGIVGPVAGVTTIVDQTAGLFRSHIHLPYQFGIIGGVYFSVYGFIDQKMNFNGYSHSDLKDQGFTSSIQTTTSFSPHIKSTQCIFKTSSGSVSIYGYNFGTDQSTTITEYTLTVNDDNFQPITSYESLFNSMIIFNRSPSNEPFKVRITKQGTASNSFIVNPIYLADPPPSSSSTSQSSSGAEASSSSQASSANNNNSGSSNVTPQPLVCPGKPEQCGGPSKGQCINGECVCKSPYITLDCSSQIIIIPEPPIDPVKPNRNTTTEGNLPNGNKITYESLISIYSLREYNSNSQ
ncbi:hypothetical protein CYY_010289, partial [Polysphondylium violaceum]